MNHTTNQERFHTNMIPVHSNLSLSSASNVSSSSSRSSSYFKVPSKSSLKKIRVEINLKEPAKVEFRPGDIIEGTLSIFKTDEAAKINDVWFNDIQIKFQNIVILPTIIRHKKQSLVNFSMTDSPDLTSLKGCTIQDLVDPNYQFQNLEFPFKFTIPLNHLDTVCQNYDASHHELLPSFGSPQLCQISFGATNVIGLDNGYSNSESFKKFQNVPFNGFCNYYSISVEVSQKFPDITSHTYVVFKRSMEIKVTNQFDIIPTNIASSSNNSSILDVASYYNINDIDSNTNELCLIKTINFKNSNNTKVGSIMATSLLPPPLIDGNASSFPIDLKYIPMDTSSSGMNDAGLITLPKLSKISIELIQYSIQSKKCLAPTTNPIDLPKSHKLIDKSVPICANASSDQEAQRIMIQKVQTVFEKEDKDLFNQEYLKWIPNYNINETQDVSDSLFAQLTVSIPSVVKDDVLKPTFHSCHLQNFYVLEVELSFVEETEQINPSQTSTHNTSSISKPPTSKKNASMISSWTNKLKKNKNEDTDIDPITGFSSMSLHSKKNAITFNIPVIIT